MTDQVAPVLILGAGINGAALARELVLNGLPVVIVGMIDVSATRRPSTPITDSRGSTTAPGSSRAPMRQVPQG